ncbi:hypothetical protein ACIPJG_33425 [Streptomyces halstedii]|uniref:hypothetical protein n=1 Tax=Streptomyces halstedii TaxID=1944 RepID=UPI00380EB5FA
MTTTVPQPSAPAPVPAAPAPVSQTSVRCLWGAVGTLAVAGAAYALYEHPGLVLPVGTLAALVAAVAAVAALVRR